MCVVPRPGNYGATRPSQWSRRPVLILVENAPGTQEDEEGWKATVAADEGLRWYRA